jgi:hypothetical protein
LTLLDQAGNLTIKQSSRDRTSTALRQRLADFKDASSVCIVLAN